MSDKDVVVVRTYSAGVHVGELVERNGKEVKLANAVRIWRWRGANTLHEIALHGIDSAATSGYSRVSEPVPSIMLTEAIEVIPCAAAAWEKIRTTGWAK